MKLKHLCTLALLAALLILQSCGKTDVVNQVNSPVVTLTPNQKTGNAGDEITIDLVTTATNNIQRIQMTEQYNGGSTKTIVDSTLTTGTTYIDYSCYRFSQSDLCDYLYSD
jgi:hypothetical protein